MTYRPPIGSGKKSDAKIIPINLRDNEGTTKLYQLSERQTKALIDVSTYLSWIKRHEFLPNDINNADKLDEWYSETLDRLMTPIEICALMIECLNSDEDVQDAFKDFFASYLNSVNNNPVGEPLPSSRTSANLASDSNPTCDPDVLFAQCKQLVQGTHARISDLLEKFEGLTNPAETFAAAADAVPAVGGTIAAIPNYMQLVPEFISENYQADYTTEPITGYEDKLAKAIFCACELDCQITIDRIFDVLLQRVIDRYSTSVPIISVLNDLASYLVGIDVGGDQVADMAHLLIWGGLKLANFIVGGLTNRPNIGDGLFQALLQLAANDPDSDWEIIVGECDTTWGMEWNLKLDDYIWVPSNLDAMPDAIWTIDEGFKSVTTSTGNTGLYIAVPLTTLGKNLRKIEIDYFATSLNSITRQIFVNNTTNKDNASPTAIGSGTIEDGLHTLVINVNHTLDKQWIVVAMNSFFVGAGHTYIFERIRMTGEGDTPF